MRKLQLGWPQVVLISVALASLAMVLTFAPPEVQSVVVEWLGWAVAGISALLGPLVRKRVAAEVGDE